MADRADGQRDREQDRLVALAHHPAEVGGHVHVGGGQHPGGVEGVEQARGGERQVAVVGIDGLEGVAHVAVLTPSSRSDSSSTSGTGGRHEKTPHGWPSTRGVSGPHMPRR